ncbi:hypothetical protein [Schaalia odontolytica]|uniref:Restriction endonuclease, SacI family n=1 Tax=Schaalia odontolytica TaxID=1660 RepID=A0A2X0TZJ8_9ACTO|nr:hypothetical protein [Schaalia odontolytica]WMS26533.1 hypothetical protein RDV55_05385 [Schaalia odontolytica]SPT55314.1 Uncharacterised protein [Schaalia odontolytica]
MDVEARALQALESAWQKYVEGDTSYPAIDNDVMTAIDTVFGSSSAPAQQIMFAIAVGVELEPDRDPASLQAKSGVDGVNRRTQAEGVGRALNEFCQERRLTWKVSQDPGVSNPFRELRIDQRWIKERKGSSVKWAKGLLVLVEFFKAEANREAATSVVDYVATRIVELSVAQRIEYPKFPATAAVAMRLTRLFLERCDNRPDALEAAITAAIRVVARRMAEPLCVNRGDVNSPDPIDIEIISESDPNNRHGVEVTDNYLTANKLRNEVIEAMKKKGLSRAVVVSRGVNKAEFDGVDKLIRHSRQNLNYFIDLVSIDVIEHWLNFPGYGYLLGGEYINELGDELDRLSTPSMRRCWLNVLEDYCTDAIENS